MCSVYTRFKMRPICGLFHWFIFIFIYFLQFTTFFFLSSALNTICLFIFSSTTYHHLLLLPLPLCHLTPFSKEVKSALCLICVIASSTLHLYHYQYHYRTRSDSSPALLTAPNRGSTQHSTLNTHTPNQIDLGALSGDLGKGKVRERERERKLT